MFVILIVINMIRSRDGSLSQAQTRSRLMIVLPRRDRG